MSLRKNSSCLHPVLAPSALTTTKPGFCFCEQGSGAVRAQAVAAPVEQGVREVEAVPNATQYTQQIVADEAKCALLQFCYLARRL